MYNWIQTTFQVGEGLAQGLALVISLTVVLVLFGLFIFIIKRLMGANAPQSRSRQPRIALMDSAAIDGKRRLMLVRRDNVEHLILVGGPSDLVVEQNIVRNTPLSGAPNRSNSYQAQPQSGSVKAALAPGPDIPMTPEDIAQAPQPLPAAETKQTAIMSAPAAPSPAPRTEPVARPFTSQPPNPEPRASRAASLMNAARSSLTASKPQVTAGAAPAVEKPAPSAQPIETPKEKAADNPFLRGDGLKKPPQETLAAAAPAAPAPAAIETKGPEPQTPSSTPLRSLTRPFSPKDRPSYGSGKISPPASGPAARAKTAVGTSSEPAQRIEPMLAKTTQQEPDPETINSEAEAQLHKTGEIPPQSETPAASETSETKEATAQKPAADLPAVMAESAVNSLPPEESANQTSGNDSDAQASEEKPSEQVAAEPKADQTDSQEKAEPETKAKDATASGEDQNSNGSDSGKSASPEKGLGDRNPIEAEMAKILDELGGQPKQ